MIEFASVHGTNFRHFQDNSDANNNDATKDIAEPEFKEK